MKKIYEINSIALSVIKTNPAALLIICSGKTRTSGWTNPQLFQQYYVKPPGDGIQELNFFAEPPGISSQVITDIEASYFLKPIPSWLKGIRIYSETNVKTEMITMPAYEIVPNNEIIGISNSFSMDEAIKDAISKIPGEPQTADALNEYVFGETGIVEGGFPGFHQLYVKLRKK
jgi:hypothetical protein